MHRLVGQGTAGGIEDLRAYLGYAWNFNDSVLEVFVAGRNLTDEETYTSLNRLNGTGALTAWPNAPRTYSLEVQFDF